MRENERLAENLLDIANAVNDICDMFNERNSRTPVLDDLVAATKGVCSYHLAEFREYESPKMKLYVAAIEYEVAHLGE